MQKPSQWHWLFRPNVDRLEVCAHVFFDLRHSAGVHPPNGRPPLSSREHDAEEAVQRRLRHLPFVRRERQIRHGLWPWRFKKIRQKIEYARILFRPENRSGSERQADKTAWQRRTLVLRVGIPVA